MRNVTNVQQSSLVLNLKAGWRNSIEGSFFDIQWHWHPRIEPSIKHESSLTCIGILMCLENCSSVLFWFPGNVLLYGINRLKISNTAGKFNTCNLWAHFLLSVIFYLPLLIFAFIYVCCAALPYITHLSQCNHSEVYSSLLQSVVNTCL